MVRRFTIRTDWGGTRRWWIVKIYPTVGQLRAAARGYDPRTSFSEAYGVCHHAMWTAPEEQQVYFGLRGYAGIIRLTDEHLTAEIVVHEIAHAAIAVYRMNIDTDVRLGTHISHQEEDLAYILGDLFGDYCSQFPPPAASTPTNTSCLDPA